MRILSGKLERGYRALLAPRPFKPTTTGNCFAVIAEEVELPTDDTVPMEVRPRSPAALSGGCGSAKFGADDGIAGAFSAGGAAFVKYRDYRVPSAVKRKCKEKIKKASEAQTCSDVGMLGLYGKHGLGNVGSDFGGDGSVSISQQFVASSSSVTIADACDCPKGLSLPLAAAVGLPMLMCTTEQLSSKWWVRMRSAMRAAA